MALLTPEDLDNLSAQFEQSESTIERVTGSNLQISAKKFMEKTSGLKRWA